MKIITNILRRYNACTEVNDHTGAALILARAMGTQEEVTILEFIQVRHNSRGHITADEQRERDQISNKYYRQLIHVTKKQKQ